MKPIIIAIVGPSCSGKDTLVKKIYQKFAQGNLIMEFPDVYYIVSCTTRPPRRKERSGKDYHFISKKIFQEMIEKNEFLEWSTFRKWNYGTAKNLVSNKPGAINIGVFNLQGIESLNNQDEFEVIPIYLIVNWKERLKRSIKREKCLKLETLRRLYTDYKDFKHPYETLCKKNNLLVYTKDYDIDFVMNELLGQIKKYQDS